MARLGHGYPFPSLHPIFFPGNLFLQRSVIISISLISVCVGGALLGSGLAGGGVGVGGGTGMGSLLVIGSVVDDDDSVGFGGVGGVRVQVSDLVASGGAY